MSESDLSPIRSPVEPILSIPHVTRSIDIFILAAGFEERAFEVLSKGDFHSDAHCILIRFINNIPNNRAVYLKYLSDARNKFREENIHVVHLRQAEAEKFAIEFSQTFGKLPRGARSAAVNVSGMPSYVICLVLKITRDHRSRESQMILYTSALEYIPSFDEYQDLIHRQQDEIELLPRSMALEMAENLVLDAFSGYRSQSAKSCLVVFAGYEAHRTTGIVDAINPALLLLLYGRPGDEQLAWRLDLSRKLHKKFERGRRTGTEEVSTLTVSDSLDVLEDYYKYLVDDYDLVISPIGSKMHSVAAYLFWEKYGEIQLTFPLPIGYDPANCPRGAGMSFQLVLEPHRALFRTPEVPQRE